MVYRFRILGKMPGMNEFIAANRTNMYKGAKMKAEGEAAATLAIRDQLRHISIYKPVRLNYTFYEANKRRDLDNISGFAHKVIQDALVRCHVLRDDGWDEIRGYTDSFEVDNSNPRIEVEIVEE